MAATKKTSTTNASKRRGGNNKTGKGGFGDRPQDVNRSGQRNREAVATAAQARELYVQLLNEPINSALPETMSNLELICRQHVKAAKQGEADERERLFDRIWGKSAQPVKHEFDELPDSELIARAAQLASGIASIIGSIAVSDSEARTD